MASIPAGDIVRAGDRVIAVVGNYGSGKTEFSVNLCLHLAAAGHRVQIADLDLVNPYFRCREARQLMEAQGIRVVVPPGAQLWADLPIVLPEIRGMLKPPAGTVSIFDVGGGDGGARALASFRRDVADGDYELWQVLNAKRPFTDSVAGCLEMRRAIESASRWTVTGLVVNTHLIDETTADIVRDGWRLACGVRSETGLPIRAVAVMGHLADAWDLRDVDAPILRLRRYLLPPWRLSTFPASEGFPLPASRSVPLGRGDRHGSHQH